MLYKQTVSTQMWELLQTLMKDEKFLDHVLVGGTALSLKIGHRLSVDIDLFTTKGFDPKMMMEYLEHRYGADEKESRTYNNTLLTYINDIKVDIVTHQYPLLNPVENIEGVRMISNEDIGAMKIHAIFQNGQRLKDFVDMYFLLEENPLGFYLEAYQKKYEGSPFWAKQALCYFKNINMEYDVSMVRGKENDWTKMAERLKKAVADPEQKFTEQKTGINVAEPKRGRGFHR